MYSGAGSLVGIDIIEMSCFIPGLAYPAIRCEPTWPPRNPSSPAQISTMPISWMTVDPARISSSKPMTMLSTATAPNGVSFQRPVIAGTSINLRLG